MKEEEETMMLNAITVKSLDILPEIVTSNKEQNNVITVINKDILLRIVHKVIEKTKLNAINVIKLGILQNNAQVTNNNNLGQ